MMNEPVINWNSTVDYSNVCFANNENANDKELGGYIEISPETFEAANQHGLDVIDLNENNNL